MHLRMRRELDRLRKDFEAEASKYPDLQLSVYFVSEGSPDEKFKSPNHAINLWQYMGCITSLTDTDDFAAVQLTNFGLSGALVTAIAVVEGAETDKFRRMARPSGIMTTMSMRGYGVPDAIIRLQQVIEDFKANPHLLA